MIITKIKVTNFRNIKSLTWEPSSQLNIIYGNNGQGKTSLIEAMWLFTGAKSFTHTKDKDLIKNDQQFYLLNCWFKDGNQSASAQIRYNGKKQVVFNNVKYKNTVALMGKLCCVVFAPNHLEFIKSSPEKRRSFIDLAISQIDQNYMRSVIEYLRALKQRNSLLKAILHGRASSDMLLDWDLVLARAGAKIISRRLWYTDLLAKTASKIYCNISNNAEKLNIIYSKANWFGKSQEELENILIKTFEHNRKQDIHTGFTNLGVHRDDLEIKLNGFSIKSYGSQGQQRSSIISLKLAECEILSEEKKVAPIVFLDDILSELDSKRQEQLLACLSGRQVFITCCDKIDLPAEKPSYYLMKDGSLLN